MRLSQINRRQKSFPYVDVMIMVELKQQYFADVKIDQDERQRLETKPHEH